LQSSFLNLFLLIDESDVSYLLSSTNFCGPPILLRRFETIATWDWEGCNQREKYWDANVANRLRGRSNLNANHDTLLCAFERNYQQVFQGKIVAEKKNGTNYNHLKATANFPRYTHAEALPRRGVPSPLHGCDYVNST